jgi:hypothetical protein
MSPLTVYQSESMLGKKEGKDEVDSSICDMSRMSGAVVG